MSKYSEILDDKAKPCVIGRRKGRVLVQTVHLIPNVLFEMVL